MGSQVVMHSCTDVYRYSKVWDQNRCDQDLHKGPQSGFRLTCIHKLMHVHILIKVWDYNRGGRTCTRTHTGKHMFEYKYAKGVEQNWGVRLTCIHLLMYVHILSKVWD